MQSKSFLRKRKTLDPCLDCFLHKERCICDSIPWHDLKTRVSLVIHAKELKRTTNSGRLAIKALANSAIYVRGKQNERQDLSALLAPEYETYILFPTDEALSLEDLKPQKPVQLIVSDGNWRQASKLNTRHRELKDVPRVKISHKNTAKHHLRKEHFAEGLSTLEAIALALKILEGDIVGNSLLSLYEKKLTATLQGRGIKIT